MQDLTSIELEFVTKCPNILEEVIVRPNKKRIKSVKEKLNNEFAEIATEINSYTVKHDDIIRDIHSLAYLWSNDENPEIIKEVISAYTPIKMSPNDIDLIVTNAVKI